MTGKIINLVHFSQLKPYHGDYIQGQSDHVLKSSSTNVGPSDNAVKKKKPAENSVADARPDSSVTVILPHRVAAAIQEEDSSDEEYCREWYQWRLRGDAVISSGQDENPAETVDVNPAETLDNQLNVPRQSASTPDGLEVLPNFRSPVEEICVNPSHHYSSIFSGDITLDDELAPTGQPEQSEDQPVQSFQDVDIDISRYDLTPTVDMSVIPRHAEFVESIMDRLKTIHTMVRTCANPDSLNGDDEGFEGFPAPEPNSSEMEPSFEGFPVHGGDSQGASFEGFAEDQRVEPRLILQKIIQALEQTKQRLSTEMAPFSNNSEDVSVDRKDLGAQCEELVLLTSQIRDSFLLDDVDPTVESVEELRSKVQFFSDCLSLSRLSETILTGNAERDLLLSEGEDSDVLESSSLTDWELTDDESGAAVSNRWEENYFAAVEEFTCEDQPRQKIKSCCIVC